ncbi:hypothetical protein [Hyphococcus sp.]|uniref:hypothetical protein n=1 Tax=Hyphococcus sp. TaxID=2038636 RepID=UPI0035C6B214
MLDPLRFANGMGKKARANLVERYGEYNATLLTGRFNRITVLDLDDALQFEQAVYLAGDTPLIVESARGYHLYYSWDGEGCYSLKSMGLDAEVKGQGGWITAPPSIRYEPDIDHEYKFIIGDYSLISRGELPKMKSMIVSDTSAFEATLPAGLITQDHGRNLTLFKIGLREVKNYDVSTEEGRKAFIMRMSDIRAERFDTTGHHPFTENEAVNIAKSAMRFELSGRNWVGTDGVIALPHRADKELRSFGALAKERRCKKDQNLARYARDLYTFLLAKHGRHVVRAMAPKKMADIPELDMSENTIRRARDLLVEFGMLELIHKGGEHGKVADPSLYRIK